MTREWIYFREGSTATGIVRISIDEAKVSAQVTPLGTLLSFPLDWEWAPEMWRERGFSWDMIQGAGELLWHDGRRLAVSLPLYTIDGVLPRDIKYVLGLTQVEEIEGLRDGRDARFDLRIILIMSAYAIVHLPIRGSGSRCIIRM